jgi:nitric oxide reductase NorQ protein
MTINISNIENEKRDDIQNEIRDIVGKQRIAQWIDLSPNHARQSDLEKSDWVTMYRDFHMAGYFSGETPTVKLETPKTMPTTPNVRHPKTGTDTLPNLDRTLDGLGLVLSDKALEPLKAGIESIRRERDAANVKAKDALHQASLAAVPTTVEHGEHLTRSLGRENLADVVKGASQNLRNREILVDVCDNPNAPKVDPNYLPVKQVPDIIATLDDGDNVLIFGDKGTGKSSIPRWIAGKLGRPYFQITFHAETSSAELFGFHAPSGDGLTWQQGDLLKAIQTPFAVLDLSEISFSRPEMVAQMFPVLENNDRTILVGGKTYHVHPTVWILATSNDDGSGEMSNRFHGTQPLNPALVDRFGLRVHLELPDQARLSKMLQKTANISKTAADMLAKFEKDLEKQVRQANCENTAGFRSLVSFAKRVRRGMVVRDAFNMTVLNSALSQDQAVWGQEYVNFPDADFAAELTGNATTAEPETEGDEIEPETRSGFPKI